MLKTDTECLESAITFIDIVKAIARRKKFLLHTIVCYSIYKLLNGDIGQVNTVGHHLRSTQN